MKAKLTLFLDNDLIARSKHYAASQSMSLSRLIESYLRTTTSAPEKKIEITPKVRSLQGSFKAPVDFDYKKVLENEIIRKHG